MWTDPPRNHCPYEKAWKGWTFLEMVGGEQKPSSYLGGEAASSMDRDVPHGPVREEKRVGGEQSPIENKGKQSTGTSTPLIFWIDSFN